MKMEQEYSCASYVATCTVENLASLATCTVENQKGAHLNTDQSNYDFTQRVSIYI